VIAKAIGEERLQHEHASEEERSAHACKQDRPEGQDYALRGRFERVEAGAHGASLFGAISS
jgi:hypothetical protein